MYGQVHCVHGEGLSRFASCNVLWAYSITPNALSISSGRYVKYYSTMAYSTYRQHRFPRYGFQLVQTLDGSHSCVNCECSAITSAVFDLRRSNCQNDVHGMQTRIGCNDTKPYGSKGKSSTVMSEVICKDCTQVLCISSCDVHVLESTLPNCGWRPFVRRILLPRGWAANTSFWWKQRRIWVTDFVNGAHGTEKNIQPKYTLRKSTQPSISHNAAAQVHGALQFRCGSCPLEKFGRGVARRILRKHFPRCGITLGLCPLIRLVILDCKSVHSADVFLVFSSISKVTIVTSRLQSFYTTLPVCIEKLVG